MFLFLAIFCSKRKKEEIRKEREIDIFRFFFLLSIVFKLISNRYFCLTRISNKEKKMNGYCMDLIGLIKQIEKGPQTSRTIEKRKVKVIKSWTKVEDELLKKGIEKYGINNWGMVAELIPRRTKKQCKERYYNHLDPNIVRKPWTEEEDQLMLFYRSRFGNKWSKIKKYLPGRTANHIKNRFFSHFADKIEFEEQQRRKVPSVFVPSNTEYTIILNSPRFY